MSNVYDLNLWREAQTERKNRKDRKESLIKAYEEEGVPEHEVSEEHLERMLDIWDMLEDGKE